MAKLRTKKIVKYITETDMSNKIQLVKKTKYEFIYEFYYA